MKKILSLAIIITSLVGFTRAQDQINPSQLPKLTQYVTDFGQVFSAEQLNSLNTLAKQYETQTTNQLVTVLFPNRFG